MTHCILMAILALAGLGTSASAQSVLYTYSGGDTEARFGQSVSGIGDFDGDARLDWAIADATSVRVLSGKGGSDILEFGIPGQSSTRVAVGSAGDVDGDGHADLLVGDPDAIGHSKGRVIVVSGLTGNTIYQIHGKDEFDFFGACVAGAGDVDHDGYGDFVVGAYGADPGGEVSLISGKTGNVLRVFADPAFFSWLGASVAGAGDVDHDGTPDVVVGAPLASATGASSGSVHVYSGATGAELHAFHGDFPNDQLGTSVDGAGDVDGDGYADIVAGAPIHDGGRGFVRVWSGADGSVIQTWYGDALDDRLGTSVAGLGDVDRDGHDDIAAGAPLDDDAGAESGRVRVFSGLTGAVLATFDGESAGNELGGSLARIGDVDREGHVDLLAGADGADPKGRNSGLARVFSIETLPPVPGASATAYCFGDGAVLGMPCPCGNDAKAIALSGCENSFGFGARLRTTGVPQVSKDTLTLLVSGLSHGSVILLQGDASGNPGGAVFGDGLLCVGGAVDPLMTTHAVEGTTAIGFGVGPGPTISVQGGVPATGGTRYYQILYRNPETFCTAAAFNLTNAVEVTWAP